MNKYLIIGILLLATACTESAPERSKLDKMNWILGYWSYSSPTSVVKESWIKTDATTLSGEGKFLDTLGNVLTTEQIEIVLKDNTLWYIPTVSNQNEGRSIEFKEKSFTDSLVVFENLDHDFPQRIAYKKTSETSILAYIEGKVDTQIRRIEFYYTK